MSLFFEKLLNLDRQCAYVLFRYCGIPRWNHFLRCHSPQVTHPASELVDEYARRCLAALFGGESYAGFPLFENTFYTGDLLASVSFVDLAPLAYEASHMGVFNPTEATPQHAKVEAFLKERFTSWQSNLQPSTSAREKVLFTQLATKGSRLWLECRPNRGEHFMRKTDWETALRARYLTPPSNDETLSCVCGHQCPAADFVVHALDCNKVTGYTWASRHAHVKRVFKSVLRQYGFCPDRNEPRFENGKGPDVCFLLGSTLTLVDVTIVNPLAPTYVEAEALCPGTTLAAAEARKDDTHQCAAGSRRMSFYPLALTTYGCLGQGSMTLLRRCARHTANPDGFLRHMCTALAVAVQIGNAGIVKAAVHQWWTYGVR
jgi:hypothetical protein